MDLTNYPKDLLYTEDHEWVRVNGEIATIGITHHAQSELGDIVYVELPEIDDDISKSDSIGTIEAVKTVADIYAPVSGNIISVNEALSDDSSCMNVSPYEDGWIALIKLSDVNELTTLLTHEQYIELIG
jgi:glycine cleavage system H protein